MMSDERVKVLMTVVKNGLASDSIESKNLCLEIIKQLIPEPTRYCDELYSMKKTVRDGIASNDIGYKDLCFEIIRSHLYR